MRLHPSAAGAGLRLDVRDSVGSTNAEALALARTGECGPLWIVAERQSAGRGRRGRSWASPAGNLHASLLLTDPAPPERAAELSFVAALAVHDAICTIAAHLRPQLKWPNDVLLDDAKVAGILIEGESASARRFAVTIGIGVNCAVHPAGTAFPATDLHAHGVAVTSARMFEALSDTMLARLAEWERGHGFATIREAWRARATGLGEEVRIVLPDRVLHGRFEELDDAGRLVMRRPDGTVDAITAGEVFTLLGRSHGSPLRQRDGGGARAIDMTGEPGFSALQPLRDRPLPQGES